MGQLTQEFMRSFLVTAFGADEKYIVPKQGNWWNPQDKEVNGMKPATWCAYLIGRGTPISKPFYQNVSGKNVSTVYMKSIVEVQLIGTYAEANSIAMGHWLNREDLRQLLDDNNMQFFATGLGEYVPSNYYQEGLNTVIAYNSKFMLQWASTIETEQSVVSTVNLNGTITVQT